MIKEDAGLKTMIWSAGGFVCSVRLGDDQGDAGLKTMIWSAAGFVCSVRLGDDQGGCSTKNYDMISSWICFLLRKGSLPWMGLKIEDLRDFCCWTPAFVWEKKSYVGCDNSCLCALKHQRLRRRKNNSDSCTFLILCFFNMDGHLMNNFFKYFTEYSYFTAKLPYYLLPVF